MHSLRYNRYGFTLIEMSIVLVIIGLVVGGVLVGRDMIQQARLQTVVADVNKYRTAINLFTERYVFYPGDHPDANAYWPYCLTGGNSCAGNGNGRVMTWGAEGREASYMWQHLYLAGLVPNEYQGDRGAPGKISYPELKFKGGYDAYTEETFQMGYFNIYGLVGNHLRFVTRNAGDYAGPVISPVDAYSIDVKTDDGKADSGKARARNGDNGAGSAYAGCLTGTSYNLNEKRNLCSVYFFVGQ